MAKLYFKYGVMGSSKSAQALIAKFNYEEGGHNVLVLKPATDTRDGKDVVKSRIGLSGKAIMVESDIDIYEKFFLGNECWPDVIICDESQFFTEAQIEQLKDIAVKFEIPVLCYGLLTDFQTKLFPGSKRLIELADSVQEIKMVCDCGKKASVNARLVEGKVTVEGEQVFIGGNESYKAMCYECWKNSLNDHTIVNMAEYINTKATATTDFVDF